MGLRGQSLFLLFPPVDGLLRDGSRHALSAHLHRLFAEGNSDLLQLYMHPKCVPDTWTRALLIEEWKTLIALFASWFLVLAG